MVKHLSLLILVAAAALNPIEVLAQCDDTETSTKTAASVEAEMSKIQDGRQKVIAETQEAISNRAIELSWTVEQKNAFLKSVSQSPEFVLIGSQKQPLVIAVEELLQELTSSEVRDNLVKGCAVGLRMVPPMRRIAELNRRESQIVLERLAAAK